MAIYVNTTERLTHEDVAKRLSRSWQPPSGGLARTLTTRRAGTTACSANTRESSTAWPGHGNRLSQCHTSPDQ
jgi:hypothetical protein